MDDNQTSDLGTVGPEDEPAPKQPEFSFEDVKAAATAEVTHKPGAVRLDGYPLLVYAPEQHGAGVRTEDKGLFVSDVCASYAETGDAAKTAEAMGTTVAHVNQAVVYALNCLAASRRA